MESLDETPKNTSAFIKSKSILQKIKEANLEKVCLLSGAQVDPDGMASMYTMAHIIESWGYTPTCFYRGAFSRPQNRVMRQVLGLNPRSETEFNEGEYTCVISLDGPAEVCPVVPDFIIDHHESGKSAKIAQDVRLVGACSSIMWEYALEAEVDFSSEAGQKLATALALGIKTDTNDGAADITSEIDFDALAFCLKHKDNKLYKEILNYSNPTYYHELFVLGWSNKVIENSVLVTGIGHIPESRNGAISYLASQYVRTEGIATAIVFALVGGSIDICMRSSNSALNVNEFVKTAFGGGGGKPGAGRVRLPIPLFENIPEDLSDMLFESCFNIVKHKALQIAGDKK